MTVILDCTDRDGDTYCTTLEVEDAIHAFRESLREIRNSFDKGIRSIAHARVTNMDGEVVCAIK